MRRSWPVPSLFQWHVRFRPTDGLLDMAPALDGVGGGFTLGFLEFFNLGNVHGSIGFLLRFLQP